MHVLVTGGAGFIGSHSVEALLNAGASVRVLDNFSTGTRKNLPSNSSLEVCHGDIQNLADIENALSDITHILHLAAQVSVQDSINDPTKSCGINIQGFVNLLQAAKAQGIHRIVYASSAAVYGHPHRLPLSEDDPVAPISPYGLEKSVNDQYAGLFHALFGRSTLGLRYFNVYGPRQDPRSPYAGVISKFMDNMRHRRALTVFGDGKQTRDFVFVKDVAQCNVQALQAETTGVCHVATGTSRSLLEMIQALFNVIGYEVPVVYQDAKSGDIPHSASHVEKLALTLKMPCATPFETGLRLLWDHVNSAE
ncbi:MAG: NAD-dependent epimerase/dehydratase family protein [Nitrospirales bacterium]|nr:NAD-dependent epimerase/dehydratase family protein [Nitrospira sp.]MDR4502698.1 NAD-dependent epimerase/dehydratase family protein [Nitrospirales bacterium]